MYFLVGKSWNLVNVMFIGVTPTVLSHGLGDLQEKANIQHNVVTSQQGESSGTAGTVPTGEGRYPDMAARRSARQSYTDNSVSAASTMETTVSPSDPGDSIAVHQPPTKANCNIIAARTSHAFQPRQGQNLTVERNTHKCSDEELSIRGNTLIHKSDEQKQEVTPQTSKWQHTNTNQPRGQDRDISRSLTDSLDVSLVQNDMLGSNFNRQPAPRIHHHVPISYHQNQVGTVSSEPISVRPKQPNVPGNGRVVVAESGSLKSKSWFSRLRKGKSSNKNSQESKNQQQTQSRVNFPFLPKFGNKQEPTSQNLQAMGYSGPDTLRLLTPEQQESKSNLLGPSGSNMPSQSPLHTEVCLVNGLPVVRPKTLPIPASPGPLGNGLPDPGYGVNLLTSQTGSSEDSGSRGSDVSQTTEQPGHEQSQSSDSQLTDAHLTIEPQSDIAAASESESKQDPVAYSWCNTKQQEEPKADGSGISLQQFVSNVSAADTLQLVAASDCQC